MALKVADPQGHCRVLVAGFPPSPRKEREVKVGHLWFVRKFI